MSEPAQSQGDDFEHPGDQTQPTAEILNALNIIKSEPQKELPPPTEYEALTAQLLEKPHSPENWRRLVDVAESTGDIEKIKTTFDNLFKQHPNTVSVRDTQHALLV